MFDAADQAHWRVYVNSGNGFDAAPMEWSLPEGGEHRGQINLGYRDTQNSNANNGDNTWTLK